MSTDNNTSIHEFDLNILCDYFSRLDRQGPGSPETIKKALSFIENLENLGKIADIGCGTGGQTLELAKYTRGEITAIDMFPKFVDLLNANARKKNLDKQVKGIVGSMDNLTFKEEELDLIWCEGAIYNIGFENGLQEWRKFLKPNGYIAVSEAAWFTDERPDEINDFWMGEYPGINTIPIQVKQLEEAGYKLIANFKLPENCWIEHYHAPQKAVREQFLKEHAGNKMVENFIAYQKHEADLYDKYKAYYGYVFYIGKKV